MDIPKEMAAQARMRAALMQEMQERGIDLTGVRESDNSETCGNCKHNDGQYHNDGTDGTMVVGCDRYPPIFIGISTHTYLGWAKPTVRCDDGCSEWAVHITAPPAPK